MKSQEQILDGVIYLNKKERRRNKSIQRKKICIFRYVGFEMFIGHSYRTVYYVLLPIDRSLREWYQPEIYTWEPVST